jgi:hypothetical protein
MLLRRLCARAALALALAPAARAETVVLVATKDNTIYSESGGTSNGAGSHCFAGKQATGWARRALVRFDVAGGVPAGATITSAKLTLRLSKSAGGDDNVTLHRMLQSWGEAGSNASGEEGAGAPAQPGDATWTYREHATLAWSSAGGEFTAAPSATKLVSWSYGDYVWGSTPALVADVQAWLDQPSQNHGWLVRGNEASAYTAKRFDTREHPTASYRPRLTIEYTLGGPCGAPSTYCVAAPNSVGPGALIGSTGSASVAANDLVLTATGAVPAAFGLFYYGPEQIQVPLGDGYRCVGPGATGTFRLNPPQLADGTGAIARPLDLTQPEPGGQITAGSTWNFQLWYRDVNGPLGSGFNFSNALSALFCP